MEANVRGCTFSEIRSLLSSTSSIQVNSIINLRVINNLFSNNKAFNGPSAYVVEANSAHFAKNCHINSSAGDVGQTVYINSFIEKAWQEEESIFQCPPGDGERSTISYNNGPNLTLTRLNITQSLLNSWIIMDQMYITSSESKMNTIVGCQSTIIHNFSDGNFSISMENYVNNTKTSDDYGFFNANEKATVFVSDCILVGNNISQLSNRADKDSSFTFTRLVFHSNTFETGTDITQEETMPFTHAIELLSVCLDRRTPTFSDDGQSPSVKNFIFYVIIEEYSFWREE